MPTKHLFVLISEIRVRLVPSNMSKPSSIICFNDRSKAALLFRSFFIICISCLSVILSYLFLAALWSLAGKTLSHLMSWVRCGI